jgi:hypothetical protein
MIHESYWRQLGVKAYLGTFWFRAQRLEVGVSFRFYIVEASVRTIAVRLLLTRS